MIIDCITFGLLDNISDISLAMTGNTLNGLQTAMSLVSVGRPVFIVNSSVDHSDTGLRLERVSGKVTLSESDFADGSKGVVASSIQSFVVSDSVFTRYTHTAVYIQYSAVKEVTLSNIVFSNNENGVYFYRINHKGGYVQINVTDAILLNNIIHFRIDINNFHESDSVLVLLERSNFVDGQQALILDGTKAGKPIVWNIVNNEFHNLTGQVMRLRGTGNVTSNIIRNNTYPGGTLVDVISASADTCAIIGENTFEENKNASSILSFCSSCDSGRLMLNAFVSNHIIDSVITCIYPSVSVTTEQFFDNVIVNNSATTGLNAYSAALTIKWTSTIEAHGNRFANPNLTFEVVNQQPSLNSSARLDFSNNYWGMLDKDVINSRIFDGSDAGWFPVIRRLLDTDIEQSFDITGPLRGRLYESVTLRRQTDPYLVSGDLLVPAGFTLTLESGVTLSVERTASVFVEGRLIAKGSTESPVRFHRSENLTQAMPLRLVNGRSQQEGRLEAFVGSEWRPICNTGWTVNNAHVACRQLGFGKGN